jgi:hypothetical protein
MVALMDVKKSWGFPFVLRFVALLLTPFSNLPSPM